MFEVHITDEDVRAGACALRLDGASGSREAARGIVTDGAGRLLLMRVGGLNCHKLPGGGIEDGETPEQAFLREVAEETGYEAEQPRLLGIIYEHKAQNAFLQKSYCMAAVANGPRKAPPEPTEKEIMLGIAPEGWVTPQEAMALINRALSRGAEYSLAFMLIRERTIIERALAAGVWSRQLP